MTGEEGFDLQTILGDIGNIDIPDIDIALFDIERKTDGTDFYLTGRKCRFNSTFSLK